MNETLHQLYERKSVRAFEERDITAEKRAAILRAAFMAPTAGDQQLYTIIEVTDNDMKAALAQSCDHQPFIARAKLVLVFCADCQKWYDAFCAAGCQPRDPDVGDFLLAVDDTLIAAQNAVTAAESLGIGSCYIGDIMENYELHRDLFHLPEYVFPAAMVVFGVPTEQQRQRPKPPRAAEAHMVHQNTYRRMDEAELFALMGTYAGARPCREWLHAFCARKFNSDFSVEMSRSVRVFLKNFDKG